ncbi:MAG TPA: class I SAM-dependent methyltransferase, partial [Verrucomicrobiae bacterium]|nr:class I SAM-dependent methyltransferase [Verrucomicrobiae bacterium]
VVDELVRPVIPCVDVLFEKFELVAQNLPEEVQAAHRNYMRRQLHPLVLCSPFAHRTFVKPLGYAGDYEMINMILRNRHEGSSVFAKVVNTWFLRQPPAQAHRNRITYLVETLRSECLRAGSTGRTPRICSLACGPAHEISSFLQQAPAPREAAFTLVDFSDEALQNAQASIEPVRRVDGAHISAEYIKRSVQQILKESGRTIEQTPKQYDFVYCAGLFDYLSDQICRRLMSVMFDWVAPGGLLVATNVEPSNPLRNGMEHLLDWHLIYRNAEQMRALQPTRALPDACRVIADPSGVNLFLEVRKAAHA